ncbi:MAG: MFS transporter [Sporolactobacillus sp.]|jgi:PPP family 3-phenylpropionic acid transporter|nr:MFS transporter [Sporolactobacillus sp.]
MNVSAHERHRYLGSELLNLRALYLFLGLIGGFLTPYLVSWFASDGVPARQAGVIMALGTLAALLLQPFWGAAVDKYNAGKIVLVLSIGVPAVLSLLFNSPSFVVLLLAYTAATVFKNVQTPISDAYAITLSGKLDISYGQIRSFLSLGMACGGWLGGQYVAHFSVGRLWLPIILLSAVCMLSVLALPKENKGTAGKPLWHGIRQMLSNKRFIFFLCGCLLVNQTLTAFDSYFVAAFKAIGGSFAMAGIGLFLASLTNIPAMLLAARVIRKIGLEKMLLLAAAAYVLRWTLQIVIIFSPIVTLLIQILHGFSFGFFYVSAVQYVAVVSGRRMLATGQSIFNMVFVGVSGIVGNMLNGFLLGLGGPLLMYISCAVSSLLGTIFLYLNSKGQPSEG